VREKLLKRWPGVRITFGFMECSVCKVSMDHPSPYIQEVRRPLDELCRNVKAKAIARLAIEKMEKDAKLVTLGSHFYGKPVEYAMASFAYYNCFKCRKFYFGGRRDCEQNAAAEVRPDEEFVCYDCADLKSIKCKNPEHSEYQVWKCRFCCNLASWFCFGQTTHVRKSAGPMQTTSDLHMCIWVCHVGTTHYCEPWSVKQPDYSGAS